MALLKFLRRPGSSSDTAPGAGTSAVGEAVQAARLQARRRLVGAVVLLGLGVIGFPLVFQTQPRPIPVDIPIEIPSRDKAAPLIGAPDAPEPGKDKPAAARDGADATKPLAAPATSGKTEAVPAADKVPATEPIDTKPTAAVAPVEVEVLPPVRAASGKAEAKPEAAKPDGDKDRGRFVVQAGSYTDLDAVREVRNKLERMGLKTYTQAAVIDGVTRVRVRVGPYTSRQEAQEVQNKIKAAGVAASLLQL